jgi:hypothetical protein
MIKKKKYLSGRNNNNPSIHTYRYCRARPAVFFTPPSIKGVHKTCFVIDIIDTDFNDVMSQELVFPVHTDGYYSSQTRVLKLQIPRARQIVSERNTVAPHQFEEKVKNSPPSVHNSRILNKQRYLCAFHCCYIAPATLAFRATLSMFTYHDVL